MTRLVRESGWTQRITSPAGVDSQRKESVCVTHNDRRKDRLPGEQQEANNVNPHPPVSVLQQLAFQIVSRLSSHTTSEHYKHTKSYKVFFLSRF